MSQSTTGEPIGPAQLVTTKRSTSAAPSSFCVSELDDEAVARARRSARWRQRRKTGSLLGARSNVANCGRRARPDGEGGNCSIQIRSKDDTAYLSGVLSCGSVWACPVCAPKILFRRSEEIDQILRVAKERGVTVLFLTLTCRHHSWDRAADLVPVMSQGMGKILAGRAWAGHTGKERQKRIADGKPVSDGKRGELDYVGQVRVLEINHGGNGFHPHVHAALFFDRELARKEIRLLEDWLFDRWNAWLKKSTDRTVIRGRGVHVEPWEDDKALGYYCTKIAQGWGLGPELTGAAAKQGKHGSRNLAQIVNDYDATGSERDAELIREIWAATHGRRMIVFSKGLRDWAGIEESEQTDEDLANVDVDGEAVVNIDVELWYWIWRIGAEPELLSGAEAAGPDGALAACWDHGVPARLRYGGGEDPPTLLLDGSLAGATDRPGQWADASRHVIGRGGTSDGNKATRKGDFAHE